MGVVDEQVDVGPKILDILLEHLGIGRFEHAVFYPKFVGDGIDHARAPLVDLLGDPLGLNLVVVSDEDVLNESSCGDLHIVLVIDLD